MSHLTDRSAAGTSEEVTYRRDLDDDAVIREYFESDQAAKLALAEARSKDEYLALPQDVREAKAALDSQEQLTRHRNAVVAFDQMKERKNERWIAAHEALSFYRSVEVGTGAPGGTG